MDSIRRKTLIIVFLISIFTYRNGYGQQTISEITANSTQATDDDLYSIYDLNVFAYFNLLEYDTELKKAVFKKTDNYKNYLDSLKVIKTTMLRTNYYIKLQEGFEDIDYDLKRKGFDLDLGQIWDLGLVRSKPQKFFDIYNYEKFVYLKTLPSKLVPDKEEHGYFLEKLFIPLDDTLGLEIENNRSNVHVYLFFAISGKENVMYKLGKDENWHNSQSNVLKSDKVRVVVGNDSTGRVYFDKTYLSLSNVKK